MKIIELFKLWGSILVNSDSADKSIAKTDKKAGGLSTSLGKGIETAAKWGAGIALAAGTASLAVAGLAINLGDDLQKALNGIEASTGYADDAMSTMKDTMLSIYNNNFGENFEDIGKAIEEVAKQTGATGKELEDLTTNALMMRDTFEFDVTESIRAANMMMSQFGITGEESYNLIAQGAQWGLDKNGDLLDTINEYAGTFKAQGFSAEEMFNMLNNGAESGAFSVDKLGDSMKEFGIRSKDGSKTSAEGFLALGLNAAKMTKEFGAGGDKAKAAFEKTTKALFEMKDPIEQNTAGVALFGTQWEDMGVEGIYALTETTGGINNTIDALKGINDVKYNSFGEALTGIKRNLETSILLPISDKVLPILSKFSTWFVDNMPQIKDNVSVAISAVGGVLTSLFNLITENKDKIEVVLSGALDILKTAFDKVKDAVKLVKENMDLLLPVIIGVTAAVVAQMVINALITAYKAWQTVTRTQTTFQWMLNAALNANPLGLVAIAIGLVVAAGVLLYKNWDTVKIKLGQFWSYVKDVFGSMKEWIVGKWNDIISYFGSLKGRITSKVSGMFDGVKDAFKGAINWVIRKWNDFQIKLGGKEIKLPFGQSFTIPSITIPTPNIPYLAKGGDITQAGRVVVGEAGPEYLDLPKGAKVTPLDKTQDYSKQPIILQTILNGRVIAEEIHSDIGQLMGGRTNLNYAMRGV